MIRYDLSSPSPSSSLLLINGPFLLPSSSNTFTWVVGFSTKVLSPIKVTSALPSFVELAFLRNVQSVEDALHRSFDRVDLLSHTPVVLFCASNGNGNRPESRSELGGDVAVTQFVLSNEDCPWGLDVLPNCPTCDGNLHLNSSMDKKGDSCRLSCKMCKAFAKLERPEFVHECKQKHLKAHRYFILPFPVPPQPWPKVKWTLGKAKQT